MKNGWKHWNDEEDALLLRLISEGLTPVEMAEKIPRRTKSAVYNRVYQKQEILDAYRATAHLRTARMAHGDRKRVVTRYPDPVIKPAKREPDQKPDNSTNLLVTLSVGSLLFSFATFLIVILALMS